jgi:hypothetical protein
MVNQEANNGRASIWRVRLRPIKLAMLPVGMAPKHAPRVRREPIQAPCASVIFRSDFSNIGRAGEVQVRHIPKQRAIKVAGETRQMTHKIVVKFELMVFWLDLRQIFF